LLYKKKKKSWKISVWVMERTHFLKDRRKKYFPKKELSSIILFQNIFYINNRLAIVWRLILFQMVLNSLSNLTIKNGDILAKIKSRKFCIKNHGYSKKMALNIRKKEIKKTRLDNLVMICEFCEGRNITGFYCTLLLYS
jgi:hypothetical protein